MGAVSKDLLIGKVEDQESIHSPARLPRQKPGVFAETAHRRVRVKAKPHTLPGLCSVFPKLPQQHEFPPFP